MGKWTDYEVQRGFTDWADLCAAHNADIDALTAERDEWQRRLDAVVAHAAREGTKYNDAYQGGRIEAMAEIRAIAEGRDNA